MTWTNEWKLVLFVCAGVLSVLILIWRFRRSRMLLDRWADDLGYEFVRKELRILRRGPFTWTSSRGQSVYFVVIRDRQGKERIGFIRLGSTFLGLLSDQVEVAWES